MSLLGHVSEVVNILLSKLSDCPSNDCCATVTTQFSSAVSLKGHGHDVSAYLHESVNSVGMIKSTCTLYAAQLEYRTQLFEIDYTYIYGEISGP